MKTNYNKEILKRLDKVIELLTPQKDGLPIADELVTIKDDGRKTSQIMQECRSLFNVYCYYLDEQLDKDFPPVISERKFRYIKEADPENANKSANDLNQKDCITLRERLLFEILYFKREGKHLDIDNITLCADSRYSSGCVPYVYWDPDGSRVCVGWRYPDGRDDYLRARSAVS